MDTYKQSFNQGLISKSASMSTSKTLNTRQFINRFNELPSYNAIHSKNHKNSTHQSDHYKNYHQKNKNSLLKLKLDAPKNSRSRLNISSSGRQKSQRKRRILNALMNTQQGPRMGDKYQSCTRKLHFQQLQMIPSAQEIFKNMKIKSNIQRLSLKINYNYYPACDFDMKKQQRFSFAPCGNPDHNNKNSDLSQQKNKQNISVIQKKTRDSVGNKMAKSFIRLKCIAFEDNEEKNLRYSEITSNLIGSMKNSRVQQIDNDCPNIRLRTEKRLFPESIPTKAGQASAESMQNLSSKQSSKLILSRQKISKKIALKSFNRFKIIKTQLKQSQKQNYQPKLDLSKKNSYIKNFIKTSNLQNLASTKISQTQHIRNNQKHLLAPHMNPISLLHPEGEFARYFQSQFNPW